jgi:glycosyltransferase involved in cell wall biosynthesis
VLWLVKGLGPGGAERLLVAAAGEHSAAEFEITCAYLLPWKQQLVGDLADRGVASTCLDVRDERDVRWAARLRRLLADHPVDIVHAHSPYPAGVGRLVARTLPSRIRPKCVYTLHNTWGSFARPTRVIAGATMRMDAARLAVSEQVRASLPAAMAERTEVLVHGIDLRAVRAQVDRDGVRRELGLSADEVVVGTVANLRPQKDYPNLLAAARILADRDVPVRILAVGQGPLEAEIRAEHHRLGLAGIVTIMGERSDAVRVMSGCDAFVLASNNEGLPVAVMEAFALGMPVVATAVGGVPEAVHDGQNGLLVPPRDPAALAAAIESVVADPVRRSALATAAAASAEQFDVRRTVDRIEAIYRAVAGRTGSR